MSKETIYPESIEDFIDHLDRQHPHRCVKEGESLDRANRAAGRREIIDQLIAWRNEHSAYPR